MEEDHEALQNLPGNKHDEGLDVVVEAIETMDAGIANDKVGDAENLMPDEIERLLADATQKIQESGKESTGKDLFEMSPGLGQDGKDDGNRTAASPTDQSSKSPVIVQQSFEEEPVETIHLMWAPSAKSLELSETIGGALTIKEEPKFPESLRVLTGVDTLNKKTRVLKESNVKLPRILGLEKFQDAYEVRCNLSHAADCIDENERLAHDLRELVIAIRPKHAEKKTLAAAVKAVKLISTMKKMVADHQHIFVPDRPSDETNTSNTGHDSGSDPYLHRSDTFSDQILDLQDELADIEATFRVCAHCAGHFTREIDRRGSPDEVLDKTSLQKDLEKLAYFAANEIQPVLRDALSAAVTASYGTVAGGQADVKASVLQQLDTEASAFYSTKLRKLAELPPELQFEVTMKRSKARSDMIINLKTELIAYKIVDGTGNDVDLQELISRRKQAYHKVVVLSTIPRVTRKF